MLTRSFAHSIQLSVNFRLGHFNYHDGFHKCIMSLAKRGRTYGNRSVLRLQAIEYSISFLTFPGMFRNPCKKDSATADHRIAVAFLLCSRDIMCIIYGFSIGMLITEQLLVADILADRKLKTCGGLAKASFRNIYTVYIYRQFSRYCVFYTGLKRQSLTRS